MKVFYDTNVWCYNQGVTIHHANRDEQPIGGTPQQDGSTLHVLRRNHLFSDDTGLFKSDSSPRTVEVTVKVLPSQNGKIVISYPGAGEGIDGGVLRYTTKYVKLAQHVQNHVGAVVRTDNLVLTTSAHHDHAVRIGNLQKVIEWSLENSQAICGKETPDIFLMGFSAGAGAVAEVAHTYPLVKRILLVCPAIWESVRQLGNELQAWDGDIYIAYGSDDSIANASVPTYLQVVNRDKCRVHIVSGCDHEFTHFRRVLSSLPIWAFGTEGLAEPSDKYGIPLD